MVEDATEQKELKNVVVAPAECQKYLEEKTIFDENTKQWTWKDLYE